MDFDRAVDIGARIGAGELTSVEVTTRMLARIEKIDSRLGAYQRVEAEIALAKARKADDDIRNGRRRSALHGVPIAIKDLLDTAGIETRYGMPLHAGHVPSRNATVVDRLEKAGTVLLGKLTLTEGAFGAHHPEIEPPRNPWDESLWVGVSSSGSGVATAAGLCYASLGTDTGGSIRFPSAANGIVGLKPTWGRVSRFGVFPLAYSLDHIGPMTRSVDDAAVMLEIMAGRDEHDPSSSARSVPQYSNAAAAPGLSSLRIGIDTSYIERSTSPQLVSAVYEVRDVLESLGCRTIEIELDYEPVCRGWMTTTGVEALHAHRDNYPSKRGQYGPIDGLLQLGSEASAEDYMRVELDRRVLAAQLDGIFMEVDFILCPSMTFYGTPRERGSQIGSSDDAEVVDLIELMKFTAPFNYSGHPSLSLPWRAGDKSVPLGVQIIGRHFEEDLILSVGRAIEAQATLPSYPNLWD